MIHFNFLHKTLATGLLALLCNNINVHATKFDGKVIIGADRTKYACITKCIKPEANLTIPDTLNIDGKDYPVKGIGSGVFKNNTNLISVTLPPSLEAIDKQAFKGCSRLTTTNLSELKNISYIGEEAFQYCASLSELIIKSNNSLTLRRCAFSECDKLQSVMVECGQNIDNLKADMSIDSYTFNLCPMLDFAIFRVNKNIANKRSLVNCNNGIVSCNKLSSLIFDTDQIKFDFNIATSNEILNNVTIPGNLLLLFDDSNVCLFEKCPSINTITVTGDRPNDNQNIQIVEGNPSNIRLDYPSSWLETENQLPLPWYNFVNAKSHESADDKTDGFKANQNNDQSVLKATPVRSFVNFRFGNQNFTKKKS